MARAIQLKHIRTIHISTTRGQEGEEDYRQMDRFKCIRWDEHYAVDIIDCSLQTDSIRAKILTFRAALPNAL